LIKKEIAMSAELLKAMAQSVIDGDPELAEQLAKQAIEAGIDPLEAINQGFVPGVDYVGEQFSCGDMFLPELVLAGEAMKMAVSVLEPEMSRRGSERKMLGKVVIGTVEGDIHDIGKTLVGTMLTSAGFKVYDLGVDVSVKKLIETAREVDADIIGVSALLTTTMMKQKTVIDELEAAGLKSRIKVMVGGAPVTQDWATRIGADGFSEDAIGSVSVARKLVGA
jgi:corrinoid protein of di/trimethylamine methyltransferase